MRGSLPDNKHIYRCTPSLLSRTRRNLPWPQTATAQRIICKLTRCHPGALGTITSANKFILLYDETIDSFALASNHLEHGFLARLAFILRGSQSHPFPAHEPCRALESAKTSLAENDGDLPRCAHCIFSGNHLKSNGTRFVHPKR